MANFFEVFTTAQQFNLLQGYADAILSEAEKMNFFLESTRDQQPLILTERGLYVIKPDVDFGKFQHTFIPKGELSLNQVGDTLHIGDYVLSYDTEAETQASFEDIDFLFSPDL